MKPRSLVCWTVLAGLGTLPLWTLLGCSPGGTGGGSDDGTANRVISYNSDPEDDLAATADDGEGGEYAVYGDKDEDGDLTSVDQVDMALADGTTVSVEFDEDGQPVYMTSSDGGEATFTYDDDSDTVIADVTTADGETAVTETAATDADAAVAAKPRPRFNKSQDTVCDNLDQAIAVLESFFACDSADDNAACDDALADAAEQLKALCATEFSEVGDVETSLGTEAQDIALGVEAFYTVRPASNDGVTLILTSTPFGGTRPYDVEWSFVAGDSTAEVENLPGGAAVVDVFVAGDYIFEVNVTDADGNTVSADIEFSSDTVSFTDILVSSAYPGPGETVMFTALGADGPAASDSDRFSYLWNFGDGASGEGEDVEHAFDESGDYVVVVIGTSESGERVKGSVVVHVDDEQDCKDVCFDAAKDEYYDCLLAGGTEEDCGPGAQATLQECALAECGEEFDCTKICHVAAQEAYESCTASGLSDADCEQEAVEALDGCLTEQCDEEVDCEELCAAGAEAVYSECLSAGLGEEDCAAFYEQVYVECTETGCDEARGCEEKCGGKAQRGFDECINNGGSELECGARARKLVESCLDDKCGGSGDCAELCGSEAHRVYDQCVAEGNAEEDCAEKTDDFYMTCQSEHCDEGPGDCEEECGAMADAMISECLSLGGTEDDCIFAAEDDFLACLEDHCGLEGDCGSYCLESAMSYYAGCYVDTGDAETCALAAFNGLNVCMVDECGETSDCPETCNAEGSAIYAECTATDTSADLCGAYALEAVAECIEEGCDDEGDEDCTEYCAMTAEIVYGECLAAGGSEDGCGSDYAGVYDECIALYCGDGEGDDDDATDDSECTARCVEAAAAAQTECLAAGKSVDECSATYHTQYDECVKSSCGD